MNVATVAEATVADLAHVRATLAGAGIEVSLQSLEGRFVSGNSGILIARDAGATLSWTLDGGALYLYDLVASAEQARALFDAAEAIGRQRFAAVMVVHAQSASPPHVLALANGFTVDDLELEARDASIVSIATLTRAVGP